MNEVFVFAVGLAILGHATKTSIIMISAAFIMMGSSIGMIMKIIRD